MTVAEAVDRINSATLVDLAKMSREAVAALPEPARRARRDRLFADMTVWRARHICEAAGVSRHAYAAWRNNYLNGTGGESALLAPFNEATEDVKRPGEDRPRGSDEPKWYAGEVRTWLRDSDRIDEDAFPLRKTSPGAPVRKKPAE
ncbi:hypothetical protein AB0B88_16105 [Micromonospora haikouensis]|uniref:hypothetical protein n=2 Tax=Actinomycetes TaxID=1760 RepID=UPI0033D65FDE